jgi:hypothetical protein
VAIIIVNTPITQAMMLKMETAKCRRPLVWVAWASLASPVATRTLAVTAKPATFRFCLCRDLLDDNLTIQLLQHSTETGQSGFDARQMLLQRRMRLREGATGARNLEIGSH